MTSILLRLSSKHCYEKASQIYFSSKLYGWIKYNFKIYVQIKGLLKSNAFNMCPFPCDSLLISMLTPARAAN